MWLWLFILNEFGYKAFIKYLIDCVYYFVSKDWYSWSQSKCVKYRRASYFSAAILILKSSSDNNLTNLWKSKMETVFCDYVKTFLWQLSTRGNTEFLNVWSCIYLRLDERASLNLLPVLYFNRWLARRNTMRNISRSIDAGGHFVLANLYR